jgi:hypothetical protein
MRRPPMVRCARNATTSSAQGRGRAGRRSRMITSMPSARPRSSMIWCRTRKSRILSTAIRKASFLRRVLPASSSNMPASSSRNIAARLVAWISSRWQSAFLPRRRAWAVPPVQRARRFRGNGQHHRPAALRQAGRGSGFRSLGQAAHAVEPAADLHPPESVDQSQADVSHGLLRHDRPALYGSRIEQARHLSGIWHIHTLSGAGDFKSSRIRWWDSATGSCTFPRRCSTCAAWIVPEPAMGDQITVGGATYIVQSEPKSDRERLVWTLDVRPA